MEPVRATAYCLCCAVLVLGSARVASGGPAAAASAGTAAVVEQYRNGPSVFVENRGQWEDGDILFALDSQGANVGLTVAGTRFQLFRRAPPVAGAPGADRLRRDGGVEGVGLSAGSATVVAMHPFAVHFVGACPVTPVGERRSTQVFNYHRGAASRWRDQVPAWETVLYRGIYPGVDLRLSGQRSALKYEFILAPGADWRPIRLRYEGIEKLELDATGGLLIHPGEAWPPVRDAAPLVYQEAEGQRQPVRGAFRLVDATTCAFDITGAVDQALPLVLDPCWTWSSAAAEGVP